MQEKKKSSIKNQVAEKNKQQGAKKLKGEISKSKTKKTEEVKTKSLHRGKEMIFHFTQAISAKLILALSVSITGILGLGLSWYFLTKSNFQDYIPVNTQAFVHIKLSEKTLPLIEKSAFLTPSPVDVSAFVKAYQLGIQHLTLLKNNNGDVVFFLEHMSQGNLRNFLAFITTESEIIETKKDDSVIHMNIHEGKPLSCIYQSRTVYCAQKEATLQAFYPGTFAPMSDLKNSLQRLPRWSDATWFLDTQSFPSPFLKAHKQSVSALFGAFVVVSSQKIQSFLYAKSNQKFTSQEHLKKSKIALNKSFPADNTFFFLSGENFFSQWIHTESFYAKNTPKYALVLKGMLAQKVQDLFGTGINFNKDILPLFQGQFAIAATKDSGKNVQWNFVAEGNNSAAVEKLVQAFYAQRGQFTVEKKELKVDEITFLQSVYSNENKVKEVNDRVEGVRIFGYSITGLPWGLFVGQKKDFTYVSTSLESLKNIIQPQQKPLQSQFPGFLKNAYEFGFISLSKIQGLFTFSPFGIPSFEPLSFIKNIAWESQSYPGGITIVSNIDLKKTQE